MPPDSRLVGEREPADLIVEALLSRFLPLARTRIDTAQASDGQYLRLADPAYDQVLDSLAMVAAHTPQPLIKALSKWRQRYGAIPGGYGNSVPPSYIGGNE